MTPAGEFSHKVAVIPWPEDGIIVELTATAAEREALRVRFDLVDLPSLSASVGIEKRMMDLVVAGTIEAIVAQTCVVTLKPVVSSLDVAFERRYRRRDVHDRIVAAGNAAALDEGAIDIDLFDGDEIDVGEVVAEEFYLALDPYPRSADADQALDDMRARTGTQPGDGSDNPFRKLKQH
ncbi:MAG: DUF177 domain-containing protein [Alphaproteobacteria bacterium]